jgi:hypothetical protein
MIQTTIKAKDLKYMAGLTDPKHPREYIQSLVWGRDYIGASCGHILATIPVSAGPAKEVLIPSRLTKELKGDVTLEYEPDTKMLTVSTVAAGVLPVLRLDGINHWAGYDQVIPRQDNQTSSVQIAKAEELRKACLLAQKIKARYSDFAVVSTAIMLRTWWQHEQDGTWQHNLYPLKGVAEGDIPFPAFNPSLMAKLIGDLRGPIQFRWTDPKTRPVVAWTDKGVRLIMPINTDVLR